MLYITAQKHKNPRFGRLMPTCARPVCNTIVGRNLGMASFVLSAKSVAIVPLGATILNELRKRKCMFFFAADVKGEAFAKGHMNI